MTQTTFATLLLSIALSLMAMAQTGPQPQTGPKDGTGLAPADLNRIKVSEAAPDFTLENQDGKLVTLSDYRGKNTVVLVFYRGYW
jgi:cytochrome oxidase Cu insertion factor (SCO1/SenC/PrrC family)